MCCRRVRIDNCFLRTSDDCIALYNYRWWYWGGSEDIDVSRCILWPDVAHPVNIGSHGDDRNPDVPDSCVLPNRVEGMKEHPVGRYTLERVSHTTVTATNL